MLVSICYSPDTKKLGVIVLRAKDLNKSNSRETGRFWPDAVVITPKLSYMQRLFGKAFHSSVATDCFPNTGLRCPN